MTKVKICGLRSIEDVLLINKFVPDYAGFVLAESKRKVQYDYLETLIKKLDNKILPVGVFVNEDKALIERAIISGLKILQLHGDEDNHYIKEIIQLKKKYEFEIWKAIRIGTETEKQIIEIIESFNGIDRFVLDKKSVKSYGGTGESFDWSSYGRLSGKFSIVLAGGLNSENVKDAIAKIKPYCVDVSSGVEENDKKAMKKISAFMENI